MRLVRVAAGRLCGHTSPRMNICMNIDINMQMCISACIPANLWNVMNCVNCRFM